MDENSLKCLSVTADTTEESSVEKAFETVSKELGDPDVVISNIGGPSTFKLTDFQSISSKEFESYWKTFALSSLTLHNML